MKTIHKHTVKIGHIRGVEVGLREINFLNIHQIGEHTLHILHLTGIEFFTKFKIGERYHRIEHIGHRSNLGGVKGR